MAESSEAALPSTAEVKSELERQLPPVLERILSSVTAYKESEVSTSATMMMSAHQMRKRHWKLVCEDTVVLCAGGGSL
jgi:flagellar biosynthesis/type III secretory pathway M-ring protein FliF/YscJ